MNTTGKNAININGVTIDLKKYLDTLSQVEDVTTIEGKPKFELRLEMHSYAQLGVLIENIAGVCSIALQMFSDNDKHSEYEREQLFRANMLSVANLLNLIPALVPQSELELLDKLAESQTKA